MQNANYEVTNCVHVFNFADTNEFPCAVVFRPKGATLCQPRPSAWVGDTRKSLSPEGAALIGIRLGPPRWGYVVFVSPLPRPLAWAGIGLPLRGGIQTWNSIVAETLHFVLFILHCVSILLATARFSMFKILNVRSAEEWERSPPQLGPFASLFGEPF